MAETAVKEMKNKKAESRRSIRMENIKYKNGGKEIIKCLTAIYIKTEIQQKYTTKKPVHKMKKNKKINESRRG